MIRVGWSDDGYPQWVMRGNDRVEGEYSVISGAVDPFRLFRLPDGTVIERQDRAIKADKSELIADGIDSVTLKGLPAPCQLMLNGTVVDVATTSYVLTTTDAGLIVVKLCGKWWGELMLRAKAAAVVVAAEVRIERDQRLTASDWTQLLDVSLSPEKKSEWTAYRTALRDLPAQQPGATLETVKWPTPPL